MSNSTITSDEYEYQGFTVTDELAEEECRDCRGTGVVGWSHGFWDDSDCLTCFGDGFLIPDL